VRAYGVLDIFLRWKNVVLQIGYLDTYTSFTDTRLQMKKDNCCVPIRLLILRPKSMYSFCEEKVHTFECVTKE